MDDVRTVVETGRSHVIVDPTDLRTLCGKRLIGVTVRDTRATDSMCGGCLKVRRDRKRRGAQGYGEGR